MSKIVAHLSRRVRCCLLTLLLTRELLVLLQQLHFVGERISKAVKKKKKKKMLCEGECRSSVSIAPTSWPCCHCYCLVGAADLMKVLAPDEGSLAA